mgnify:CR=1 FL=1
MSLKYEGTNSVQDQIEACTLEIEKLKAEPQDAAAAAFAAKLTENQPKIDELSAELNRLSAEKKSILKVTFE